jgi:hypothetical protein
MKRVVKALGMALMAVSFLAALSGCYSTGRAIGESLRKVEAKIDRFQEGYEDGRYGYFEGPSPFDILEEPGPDLSSGPMPDTLGIQEPAALSVPEPLENEIEEPIVPDVPREP